MKSSKASVKRGDLQGIRGMAVLLVLAFHLKPNSFRLGFIGVDMFFVLSGYLMSIILAREAITLSVVKQFYLRRFKRIVPLFYTIVFLIFLGCHKLLALTDKEQLVTDLKWTIPFVSNIQPIYQADGYWDQILSYRFLVHAWSLGIELQFYCIVPLIFGVGQFLGEKSKWLYMVFVISSLLFQIYSPPKISYGLLHCRIWQFLTSVVLKKSFFPEEKHVYHSIENGTEYSGPSPFSRVLCDVSVVLLVATVGLDPFWMTQTGMRVVGTFLTALLVNISDPKAVSILNNSVLSYFGDISYTLYLVHWPVIVAIKYYLNVEQLNNQTVLFTLVLVVILSILIHHTIEKFLVRAELSTAVVVSLCCVGAVLFWSPFYVSDSIETKSTELTAEEYASVIQWNIAESKKAYFDIPCERDKVTEKWTKMRSEPQLRCQTYGTGSVSILILGNSIGYRAFPLIHDILAGRYKELRLFSASGQAPLLNARPSFADAARTVVDHMRPDVIFHIFAELQPKAPNYRPLNRSAPDSTFLTMQKNIDYFSARSKRMVIEIPYYMELKMKVAYELAKRLEKGTSLEDMKINRTTDDLQQHYHRLRLKSLKCENCVYHHINEAVFEGDYYYFYNRTSLRAYTGEGWHFTPEGLQLVRPSYEKIINQLLAEL